MLIIFLPLPLSTSSNKRKEMLKSKEIALNQKDALVFLNQYNQANNRNGLASHEIPAPPPKLSQPSNKHKIAGDLESSPWIVNGTQNNDDQNNTTLIAKRTCFNLTKAVGEITAINLFVRKYRFNFCMPTPTRPLFRERPFLTGFVWVSSLLKQIFYHINMSPSRSKTEWS